jgi:threonine/homoserine/homoserine lactone efflux protein
MRWTELEDCRGQSYDNQATMTGVQKRIFDLNPLAVLFTATITLSLVGVHATYVNVQAQTFWYCGTFVWILFMFNSPVERSKRHCQYYS